MASGSLLSNNGPLGTPQQYLLAAKASICVQIWQHTLRPKVDYSFGGKSIQWESHFTNLVTQLKEIESAIIRCDGAFEIQGGPGCGG